MYILYFKTYNFVIITYSRCWSKTLIKWISKIYNIDIKTHGEFGKNKNICLNSYSVDEILNILNSCEIYIIIRNPYDRIINATISHHTVDNLSFLEFVETQKNWNFKYYSPLIDLIVKKYNVNILKFENLQNDLLNLCMKYKIEIPIEGVKETKNIGINNFSEPIYEMKLINFCKGCPHYKYFYNQYIIDKIYSIFKIDFDLFNIDINIDDLYPKINIS